MSLGLLFLKRSDKQAWFKYIVMIVAIMLSMAMLLSSVAIGNAASRQIDRNAWHQNIFSYSDRDGVSDTLDPASQKTILELNHTYFNQDFKQYSIQELGIRQISSDSPLPPNLARQPEADEIFVSQSLLNLINSHPTLKERYADYKISLGVPDDLLTSPDNNLLIYRISDEKINHSFNHHNDFATFGHDDLSKFSAKPDSLRHKIITAFMLICGLGVCFPMLILLISAMRIGMVQREQRYAALSLIGTSKRQVNQIILLEALSSTFIGVLSGIGLYELLRFTILSNLRFGGDRFFTKDISVSPLGVLYLTLLIFAITVLVNFIALRKVKSSPLGVAKIQKLPKKPSFLRLIPALIAIFATLKITDLGGDWFKGHAENAVFYLAGLFLLSMISLLLAGSYITLLFAKLFNKLSRGVIGTLASKRLKIFAKTIFSSVSGVVLALFVGSFFFTLIASIEHTFTSRYDTTTTYYDLNRAAYQNDVIEISGEETGLTTFFSQIDHNQKISPRILNKIIKQNVFSNEDEHNSSIKELYTCAELAQFTVTKCKNDSKPDSKVILVKNYADRKYYIEPYHPSLHHIGPSGSILIKFSNADDAVIAREQLRSLAYSLSRNSGVELYVYQPSAPVVNIFESISGLLSLVELGTILTIIVAGFSVTVSAIGGVFERKKSFSNLKLMGIYNHQLFLVVLLESAIPIILSSIIAVTCGILFAKYILLIIGGGQILFALPSWHYLWLVTASLFVSILLIFCTLPILKQVTSLEQNRTE